ncbi:hypothetical protein FSB73_17915 [Arachidicoccus ginsenosidivorans]|uniref:Lipoprotein n=1 Tax=Arachidicoccus ginsenosidivorans TaxID=496057 RepID=A0A5B8VPB0_9BACT|nr:hypothetical protein [Arachidicoccus ginsenosidivorans]QEC73269.1 hypothetical protein FSB73_17915 [Arachidicoccus ginsenosidivorans]
MMMNNVKNTHWKLFLTALVLFFALSCGSGKGPQHLNDNPNDMGMPDSATISDSPMPGQPSGYNPAGTSHPTDTANGAVVDSTTKGKFQ